MKGNLILLPILGSILLLAILPSSTECANSTASNSTTKFTPLNGQCFDNLQCGANTFCNQQSKCACELGFVASTDLVNCHKFPCISTAQCNGQFGTGVSCYNFDHCFCDESFAIDTRSQTCVPIKQRLNTACTTSAQCGANTFCNPTNRACNCKFDYTPSSYNQINCDQVSCLYDYQCTAQYGKHSQCAYQTTCQCNSASGWMLNATTQQCAPQYRFLNSSCDNTYQCGQQTSCASGKCRCRIGAVPDLDGDINCNSYQCSTNADCQQKFGAQSHLKCFINTCTCDYEAGYTDSTNQTTCVQRAKFIGDQCLNTADCGIGADCVHGQCACQFAWTAKSNNMDCSQAPCTLNSDCTRLFPNSQCNTFTNFCTCASGYIVDYVSQKCYKLDFFDNTLQLALAIIFTSVCLSVVAVILIVLVRNRRRRAQYIQKS